MNNQEMNEIYDLIHTYKIGKLIESPLPVSGGLMHKMYKVVTDTRVYAIKCLNPTIMKRKGVVDNMIQAERIAAEFSGYLPVVAAIDFDGSPILHINHKYYMLFPWVEGTSLFPPSINVKNCYEIGSVLGKIHKLNISVPEVEKGNIQPINYNWHEYYEKGVEQKTAWIDIYGKSIDNLNHWTSQVNEANSILSECMLISHRDLDPKNVMWEEEKPYLIDWEAAGYVNPYQELLEMLIYWSDNGEGELDKKNFNSLLNAYRSYMTTNHIDWDYVLDSGYAGMLGWLGYSLNRALGMESVDVEEQKLGAKQVIDTIAALNKYNHQKKAIKIWLSE